MGFEEKGKKAGKMDEAFREKSKKRTSGKVLKKKTYLREILGITRNQGTEEAGKMKASGVIGNIPPRGKGSTHAQREEKRKTRSLNLC